MSIDALVRVVFLQRVGDYPAGYIGFLGHQQGVAPRSSTPSLNDDNIEVTMLDISLVDEDNYDADLEGFTTTVQVQDLCVRRRQQAVGGLVAGGRVYNRCGPK